MTSHDFDLLPRMLWEQCDRCGEMGQTVYGRPRMVGDGFTWECRICWLRPAAVPALDLTAAVKLRRLLRSDAAKVHPSPDAFTCIRARTSALPARMSEER